MVKFFAFLIILMAGVLGYGMYNFKNERAKVVLEHGEVTVKSRDNSRTVSAKTRKVRHGTFTHWEYQNADGDWIHCSGECARALRRHTVDKKN